MPCSDEYIYIDMIPTAAETAGPYATDHSILIDLAVHTQAETNRTYLDMAAQIDRVIRPVFRFADRAITVGSAESRIVDRVLHYRFSLSFRAEIIPAASAPIAETLHTNITRS